MSSAPVHFSQISTTDAEHDCPFGNVESGICSASLSSMVIGPHRRRSYCSSDNYDNCPVFLAKMLRKKDW
jgi:hypothetical protein